MRKGRKIPLCTIIMHHQDIVDIMHSNDVSSEYPLIVSIYYLLPVC